MNFRKNAGYIITDSIHVGEIEFVLGVHSEAPFQFVTWACKDGKDYYWGHNHSDLMSATKDLIGRAKWELEFCMRRREQAQASQKEPEDMCL